jgi:RNA polymerase sigma factor (sigma-70 family)
MKDYRVKITIRNERLLTAIEGMGFESVAKFCAEHILDYTRTSEIIRGKLKPINENGKLNNVVENLLNILELDIKDAFTPRQLQGFKNTSYEVKVKEKELKQLVNPVKNQELKYIETEVQEKISEVLTIRLTPREEKVVRMRFGIGMETDHTLDEISQELNVSNARIGQILAKAIRKLKHPSVACHLINTGFYDTFTKVAIKPEQIKQAENYLIGQKIEKEHKKETERNLMERKKIHLKNFIREISNHRINYKSKLWTYSLCKQGLREGFFPRSYYRTTRNCWNWLSNNLRSIMQEEIQNDKIVARTLKALRKVEKRGVVGFYFNNSGHKKERICYGK